MPDTQENSSQHTTIINAVAGILIRFLPSGNRQCLLGQRPLGKVYENFWEFPGGKIEEGESASAAIKREIREELGVNIIDFYPWLKITNNFAHGQVHLQFFIIESWENSLQKNVHQELHWQDIDNLHGLPQPLLPANQALIGYLQLPTTMYITNASEDGYKKTINKVLTALAKGARLFQLRDKNLPEREQLLAELTPLIKAAGGEIIVNDDLLLAEKYRASGIHLSSQTIEYYYREKLALANNFKWRGASVHDQQQLMQAISLGCDYLIIGHVLETPSHPGKTGLGWQRFAQLVALAQVPVFAIGAMDQQQEKLARSFAAHGSARLRFW